MHTVYRVWHLTAQPTACRRHALCNSTQLHPLYPQLDRPARRPPQMCSRWERVLLRARVQASADLWSFDPDPPCTQQQEGRGGQQGMREEGSGGGEVGWDDPPLDEAELQVLPAGPLYCPTGGEPPSIYRSQPASAVVCATKG